MLYTNEASDRAIVEAVAEVARVRGVSLAQIALAWLRKNPVVVAPIIGASKASHIDDAIASLEIQLTDEEVDSLERPYTPRYDFQGVSDDAVLARISARLGIKPATKPATAVARNESRS
jgi:diketogulonate reductase-like aldo/keto reductase